MTPDKARQKAQDIIDEACLGVPLYENGVAAAMVNAIATALLAAADQWHGIDGDNPAPRDGSPILVWDEFSPMQIVEWDASGKDGYNWSDRGGSFFHLEDFTHWRHLPAPPMESSATNAPVLAARIDGAAQVGR